MKESIASLRQEYLLAALDERDVLQNPILQFQLWFREAVDASIEDANAMVLSTIDNNNKPRSRVVLLKGIQENELVFFTNYYSHKGREIDFHPQVSLVFHWKELQRQIRIEGEAVKISPEDSEAYFKTRPFESQLGAWVSAQSELLDSRETLEKRYQELARQYKDLEIPRPPHWGGYSIKPAYMEFWQGRANRLHDRICFTRDVEDEWLIQRLNP